MNLGDPSSMPGPTEAFAISVARQYDQPDQWQALEDLAFMENTKQHDYREWSEFVMRLSFNMSLVETTSSTGLHSLNDQVLSGECLLVLIELLQSATGAGDPSPLQATNSLADLMDAIPPNYAKLLERLAIHLGAVEGGTSGWSHLAVNIPLLQRVAGGC